MKNVLTCVLKIAAGVLLNAQGASSVVNGTIKKIDAGAKTITIATANGAEEVVEFSDKTIVHGTATGAKDAFKGLKEGAEIAAHYTASGTKKVASEVDNLGTGGLRVVEVPSRRSMRAPRRSRSRRPMAACRCSTSPPQLNRSRQGRARKPARSACTTRKRVARRSRTSSRGSNRSSGLPVEGKEQRALGLTVVVVGDEVEAPAAAEARCKNVMPSKLSTVIGGARSMRAMRVVPRRICSVMRFMRTRIVGAQ